MKIQRTEDGRTRTVHTFDPDIPRERSRTKQAERNDADINQIVKRAKSGHPINSAARGTPRYGDFSSGTDYGAACTQIRHAQEDFHKVPALIRKRFNNDPAELISFLANGDNLPEAISLGLVSDPNTELRELGAVMDANASRVAEALKPAGD